MADASFAPLKEVGTVELNAESEIKFYVDEYKGFKYASIRTFLKREGYTGPTKSGVTLNPNLLGEVINVLSKLPAEPSALQDQELARFPKKMGTELVVRITIYKDTTGVDFREWIEDGSYKGWSKKGVRVPYKDLKASLGYLKEMQAFLQSSGSSRPAKSAA
ncbi:MAG: transcriptional coactivator p15/PC4 family protein [Elusimicrobia bacterium]|nr:transcriptional coactivator p15/PC4 family protein [Elusimicrobiota bacterium]